MSVEAAVGLSPGEKGEQICPSQPTTSRLRGQKVTAGGEEAIKKEGSSLRPGRHRHSRRGKSTLPRRAFVGTRLRAAMALLVRGQSGTDGWGSSLFHPCRHSFTPARREPLGPSNIFHHCSGKTEEMDHLTLSGRRREKKSELKTP
ncbi:unnamed protein product [Tetraodon nigroviridis]|uniref:(spotted green pufferfish) hypothetical protein n=1 Tax=Tetraodon nigroviridis TaxID=99883 RepID=Q4SQL0_TETNG|nr:unnamed protein product [Tetraodon nigroviridis]